MEREKEIDSLEKKGFIVRDWNDEVKFTEKGFRQVKGLMGEPRFLRRLINEK